MYVSSIDIELLLIIIVWGHVDLIECTAAISPILLQLLSTFHNLPSIIFYLSSIKQTDIYLFTFPEYLP